MHPWILQQPHVNSIVFSIPNLALCMVLHRYRCLVLNTLNRVAPADDDPLMKAWRNSVS